MTSATRTGGVSSLRGGVDGSDLFRLVSETFVVLAMVRSFGVVSGEFFSRQGQLTQLTVLLGVVALFLAPAGAIKRGRLDLLAVATMGWYITTGFWTTDAAAWQDFMFYLVALPTVAMVVFSSMPFERVIVSLKRVTYVVVAWIFVSAAIWPSRTTAHAPIGDDPPLPGWHGTFIHKNEMMTFLVIGLITVLVFERDRRLRLTMVVVTYVLAVLGQSGTGLSVVTLTLLANGTIKRLQQQTGKRRDLFLLTVITGWALLAVLLLIAGPTLVRLYGKDLTFTGRTDIWAATLDAVGERPWTGYGIGSVWLDFASQPTASLERAIGFRAAHAHNGALELLLETGVVGLVLWSACFAGAIWACWRLRRTSMPAARWGLLICAAVTQLSVSETTTFRGPWLLIASLSILMTTSRYEKLPRH